MPEEVSIPKDGDAFYSYSLNKRGFIQLYEQDTRFTALPIQGLGYVKDLSWDKRKKSWIDLNDKEYVV